MPAQMKFEEAAVLRDRIKGLQAYTEQQKAVDLDPTDRDIIAFAAEGDDACGVIFKLRDGKMVGRQHYYMGNVDGKPGREILETPCPAVLSGGRLHSQGGPRSRAHRGPGSAPEMAVRPTGRGGRRASPRRKGKKAKLVRLSNATRSSCWMS